MILGVLCNARDPLVAVLAGHGITFETARGAVRAAPAEPENTPTSDEDRYAEDREALKISASTWTRSGRRWPATSATT